MYMSICLYVYMYVYIYIYICIYVYLYICVYIYTYIYISIYIMTYVYIYIYIHNDMLSHIYIYIYIKYIYIPLYVCIYIYIYIYIYMYTCIYVCVCVCVCVCTNTSKSYLDIQHIQSSTHAALTGYSNDRSWNLHPVRITRIHVTRLSPRVGLPRQKHLIGTWTGALRLSNIFQGLGPKKPESSNADWVYSALRFTHSRCCQFS